MIRFVSVHSFCMDTILLLVAMAAAIKQLQQWQPFAEYFQQQQQGQKKLLAQPT